eukprot:365586-Chlamydomonas_euryale.AAC.6
MCRDAKSWRGAPALSLATCNDGCKLSGASVEQEAKKSRLWCCPNLLTSNHHMHTHTHPCMPSVHDPDHTATPLSSFHNSACICWPSTPIPDTTPPLTPAGACQGRDRGGDGGDEGHGRAHR